MSCSRSDTPAAADLQAVRPGQSEVRGGPGREKLATQSFFACLPRYMTGIEIREFLLLLVNRLKFSYQKYTLGYRPDDLVLDVGSGNNPHPRADLLCDQFLLNDTERGGPLQVDRPLVGGDIEHLPFRDKSIDFVIASHILEHVHDPRRAIAELRRVARRGYIETPAEFGGKLLDIPFHRWYVRLDQRKLIFTGKSTGMHDAHLNEVSYKLWRTDREFQRFFWNHLDLFLVRLTWDDTIDLEVVEPAGELYSPETFIHTRLEDALESKPEDRSLRAWAKGLAHRYYHSPLYGRPRTVDLNLLCACPMCKGTLSFGTEVARCSTCAINYPVLQVGGREVPTLINALAAPVPC